STAKREPALNKPKWENYTVQHIHAQPMAVWSQRMGIAICAEAAIR
ncbi:9745_t:CDS:1, partial [Entrophospora sp. SA101]